MLGGLAQQGELLRDALKDVPLTVEPWEALRQALHAVDALAVESGVTLKIAKMMYGSRPCVPAASRSTCTGSPSPGCQYQQASRARR